jgi:hypothetical protein
LRVRFHPRSGRAKSSRESVTSTAQLYIASLHRHRNQKLAAHLQTLAQRKGGIEELSIRNVHDHSRENDAVVLVANPRRKPPGKEAIEQLAGKFWMSGQRLVAERGTGFYRIDVRTKLPQNCRVPSAAGANLKHPLGACERERKK